MFVRVKTNQESHRHSVQIVHSIRKGKKVSQQIIRHIGIAYDELELEQLKEVAESIKIKMENTVQPPLFSPEELDGLKAIPGNKEITSNETTGAYRVNLKEVLEEERVISGIHDIYGKLFDEMGYSEVIDSQVNQSHPNIVKIFKDVVLARIALPLSKHATVEMLAEDFGITLPLHKVYRMMDKLDDEAIKRLNQLSHRNTRTLFGHPLDVVFFDATTLYFESFEEDDLRRLGYSKDMKFNQPQVLLALLVTREGLPVGYKVFQGDTYEGHTLVPVLEELKRDYQIKRVVFVADSGMLSRENLNHLESQGFEYIVGARLKNMPESIKSQILDKSNYVSVSEEGDRLDVAEFNYCPPRRLIVSYKEKRARKDSLDRKKAILKLKKKLDNNRNQKSYLSNYGYKKYLKIEGESRIQLDEKKIAQDSRWDGLHGVITNIVDFNPIEVLEYYSNLWTVEESFRITKHDLKVRPVFHWNPARVKAHIAIVFTAYSLVRYMTYRVKLKYKKLSPQRIRKALLKVQTSIIYDKKKKTRYGLPSKTNEDAKRIYDVFKVDRALTPYIISL